MEMSFLQKWIKNSNLTNEKIEIESISFGETADKGNESFYKTLYGLPVAQKVYASIKKNIESLTYYPGIGYIEPTLEDYPQCFRTFVQHPNLKIVYWVEDGYVKIAMFFDTRQKPEKLRYTIEHNKNWVCEDFEPYGQTDR